MRGYIRGGSFWIVLLVSLLSVGLPGCSDSRIEQEKRAAEFGEEGRVVAVYVYRYHYDTSAVLENSRGERIIVKIDDNLVAVDDTWKIDWSSKSSPVLGERIR